MMHFMTASLPPGKLTRIKQCRLAAEVIDVQVAKEVQSLRTRTDVVVHDAFHDGISATGKINANKAVPIGGRFLAPRRFFFENWARVVTPLSWCFPLTTIIVSTFLRTGGSNPGNILSSSSNRPSRGWPCLPLACSI